jgi:hypothetical protein
MPKENRPLKIKCLPNNGIRCPIFGGSGANSDLGIADKSDNKNKFAFNIVLAE